MEERQILTNASSDIGLPSSGKSTGDNNVPNITQEYYNKPVGTQNKLKRRTYRNKSHLYRQFQKQF